ncbi:MAG: hypothetical protein RugAbin2_01584 [Rugosibacter sp.]|jgi:dTDP-4-dehydrorhamnose 3,5-epimerase-like enzyme|nr:hypothetical protein [Rugosibacter sp.]
MQSTDANYYYPDEVHSPPLFPMALIIAPKVFNNEQSFFFERFNRCQLNVLQ